MLYTPYRFIHLAKPWCNTNNADHTDLDTIKLYMCSFMLQHVLALLCKRTYLVVVKGHKLQLADVSWLYLKEN